jgi:hypothetical protein
MAMMAGVQDAKGRLMPLSRIAAAAAGALVMAGLASSAQAQWGPPGYVYAPPPGYYVVPPPRVYYPPPVYYRPPAVVYAPPPVYYAPPPPAFVVRPGFSIGFGFR